MTVGARLSATARRFSAGPGVKTLLVLFFVGLVPVVGLGAYAYRTAAQAVDGLVRSNNLAAAKFAGELAAREFEHRVNVLDGFSRGADFRDAVRRGDEGAVRRRLKTLVEAHPRVVRAFVTDPGGLLWSDYPKATESLGKTFAHRDWYKGVSAAWRPYVSEVYRRHAAPQFLLVAIAAPVRDADGGRVVGVVAYQVTLGGLTDLLNEVEVGRSGFAFIVDHNGTVAAHPRLELQERIYREYAGTAPVAAANGDDARVVDYSDPLLKRRMLATAVPVTVGSHRWAVVAQQPLDEAYHPLRRLAFHIGGAGALVALVMAALFAVLARYHRRGRRLNLRLADVNEALATENRERRRAEAALADANEALERRVDERTRELRETEEQLLHAQKMEAVGRLAGGVAHDFNNLLTVIIGYCDVLLRGMPEDDPRRPKIAQVHGAGRRAATLTRQLLAFSRRQVLRPEVIDLNRVVENMSNMLRRLIGEDIELRTRLSEALDPVEFDPSQIEQILMNLVVNARDAMPDGGTLIVETANVTLDDDYVQRHADARPGPHVMIAVSDTGAGMDAETRDKIFEPFFTTKRGGHGTGLGLSTVYGIVKQSGGNIWVYSEPGRGTVFKVYLPRAATCEAAAAATAEKRALPRGTETILVVEDEDDVRSLIRDVLESGGYRVLDAGDADQAVAVAEAHDGTIDLLLTDVVLPGAGGPDLAERLADLRPGLKVAYMSGYTDNAIVHHGVLDPGTAFLEKPIEVDTLLEKVREFLS